MSSRNESSTLEATILEIQRLSTEDGPGIRTTVFFKGCSLRCSWCQNPESLSPAPQTQWVGSRCIGCGLCAGVCPEGALAKGPEGTSVDHALCAGCGTCADECPSTAMELLGRQWTVEDLTTEVMKDQAYFEKSGGGVTASGGEPAMQAPFVAAFLANLRARGVHTALDTCGQVPADRLDLILPQTDLVLYDVKEIDPEKHKAHAGSANDRILANLARVRDHMKRHGMPRDLWIRTPVIPGATAEAETIGAIGAFIASNLDSVASRWELCTFNNLCADKYARIGMDWAFRETALISEERMEALAAAAAASGVDPGIVHWSGITAEVEDDAGSDNGREGLSAVKGFA